MRADHEPVEARVRRQMRLDRRGLPAVPSGAVEQVAHGSEMRRAAGQGLLDGGVDAVGGLRPCANVS